MKFKKKLKIPEKCFEKTFHFLSGELFMSSVAAVVVVAVVSDRYATDTADLLHCQEVARGGGRRLILKPHPRTEQSGLLKCN